MTNSFNDQAIMQAVSIRRLTVYDCQCALMPSSFNTFTE